MSIFIVLLTSVMIAVLSCGTHHPGGPRSSGELFINGVGVSGSVQIDAKRYFTLRHLQTGSVYTVKTQIGQGNLLMSIYTSEAAYLDNESPVAEASPVAGDATYYEVSFTAPVDGDYVVVLSGTPGQENMTAQFFYDLRILSGSALTSFATTTLPATATGTLIPGYVHVYSGATITPSGTYAVSLSLVTSGATTLSAPQIFVYSDNTLLTKSLLYSSIANSQQYRITEFLASGETTSYLSDTNSIPNVTVNTKGPFILLKGNVQVDYSLTVGP
ncbi:MAG: hypothetical protein M0042_01955 [Nitrospiraceae bacterium]|nr:hypothetical protein [Nitrospiraceae bacterium]